MFEAKGSSQQEGDEDEEDAPPLPPPPPLPQTLLSGRIGGRYEARYLYFIMYSLTKRIRMPVFPISLCVHVPCLTS